MTDSYCKTWRLTKFEGKCNNLFPVGRKFTNYRQLDAYVTQFLHSWNIVKIRDGYISAISMQNLSVDPKVRCVQILSKKGTSLKKVLLVRL